MSIWKMKQKLNRGKMSKRKYKTTTRQSDVLASVITNKWTFAILYALSGEARRFNEMNRQLNTTQKVLTDTLKKLQRNGMVERTVYPTVPPQVDYRLTPLGCELLKLSEIMTNWAEKHGEEIRLAQKAYDNQNNQ